MDPDPALDLDRNSDPVLSLNRDPDSWLLMDSALSLIPDLYPCLDRYLDSAIDLKRDPGFCHFDPYPDKALKPWILIQLYYQCNRNPNQAIDRIRIRT